jgi:hypothetical protein
MLSVKLAGLDVAPDDVLDLTQRLRNDGSKRPATASKAP